MYESTRLERRSHQKMRRRSTSRWTPRPTTLIGRSRFVFAAAPSLIGGDDPGGVEELVEVDRR